MIKHSLLLVIKHEFKINIITEHDIIYIHIAKLIYVINFKVSTND